MPPEPLTIADAAPLVRSGVLTPSDLLEQCLARVDVYEPRVQAWAYLDRERARRDAARLTDELKRGQHRGPLHGIPVGIKDIIDVFDMPTGCGSKAWANSYARKDATVVERLRQAGAVILGKTVTTPFAFLDPPPTRNPWNLDRTPGGSSSGSAAAVACGMVLAALGTQTGGSLTRPASYCGVCSLKPTWGRVSVDGVLPLAPSLDHVGVMANCARDLLTIFRCISKNNLVDEDEQLSQPGLDQLPGPEDDLLSNQGLFEKKLYVPTLHSLQRCEVAITNAVLGEVIGKASGDATRFEFWMSELPEWFAKIWEWHRTVMSVQAAKVHGERFARCPEDYPPKIAALIEEGQKCEAVRYAEASEDRWNRQYDIQKWIGDGVLITPATTTDAPEAETTGDPAMNSPWSYLGLPTVSIPIGRSQAGLPIAVQFVAPCQYKELRVLRVAAAIEDCVRLERRLPPVT